MPNLWLAAGVRIAVLIPLSLMGNVSANGQSFYGSPFPTSPARVPRYSGWDLQKLEEAGSSFGDAPQVKGGPATVSSDQLKHPLTSKAYHLLQKAMHFADIGNHPAAIQHLREVLVKDPSSAPYAENLLGVEYLETSQFAEAKTSFEEAVRLMPHESTTHSNLGLSMAFVGDWESAEREERQAIHLDHSNAKAKSILDVVLMRKRHRSESAPATPAKP